MKILYCHDNVYYRTSDGRVLSQGQFPYEYWKPFLEVFGNITVAARGETLSPTFDSSKMNVSSGPGVEFCLMPNMNSIAGLLKHKAENAKRIKEMVTSHNALIIRAVSEIGWLAYKEAQKQNKPFAMEMAACAWDSTWNHGNLKGKVYAPLRMWHDQAITKDADFVMYVSREFLPRRYPTNGQTEFASNVRIHAPPQEVMEQRLSRLKTSNSGDRPFVIGLIGTLNHKIKGVRDALEALALLKKSTNRQFIFRHLGPGDPAEYREQAQKLSLQDIVHFDGMVPSGDAVLRWLDGVDLYIQPSYQEGVPRAAIEAMSRGCPFIGSTAGGISELVPHEWQHRPGDFKTLAGLMKTMIEDFSVQFEMANRNFALAKTYTSDVLMLRLPSAYSFYRL